MSEVQHQQERQRRAVNKLSPRSVATIVAPGRHSDGGGLYLVVDPSGARRWAFLFRWRRPGSVGPGRLREMGLGAGASVSLARAREKAAAARRMVADGIDPIAAKRAKIAIPTFGDFADEVIEVRTEGLRNEKSKARWKRALTVHAAPLRTLGVDAVDTEDILRVLKPIWSTKPETAQKTRGYIEAVLDAARARNFRVGDNPARWRGHLDHLLAKPQKLSRGHHAAMPYAEVAGFLVQLRSREGVAALALEFLILTAARTGEVLGANWSEINLDEALWTVPGHRMKAGLEHRVPLSNRALAIVCQMAEVKTGEFVFPGQKKSLAGNQPLSTMAFDMLLRRLGSTITTHGFRSSFRDWAFEVSVFPREIAEAALAHSVGDATERAYRRGDALLKRRQLMQTWAAYIEADHGSNVTVLSRAVGQP